jgi:hypothetical protein
MKMQLKWTVDKVRTKIVAKYGHVKFSKNGQLTKYVQKLSQMDSGQSTYKNCRKIWTREIQQKWTVDKVRTKIVADGQWTKYVQKLSQNMDT